MKCNSEALPSFAWGAAAVFFLLLLSSLIRAAGVPFTAAGAFVSVTALAVLRPAAAFAIVAVALPVASFAGRQSHGGLAWAEALVVAFLAGYSARSTCLRQPDATAPLRHAGIYVIATVVASLAVQLWMLHVTHGPEALSEGPGRLLTADYFLIAGRFQPTDAATRMAEGVLLAIAAASVAARDPRVGPLLARVFVLGAAAASGLNLWRLWQGAARLDNPVLSFLEYLITVRFNVHHADINAAGSYYVMALLPAAALVRVRRSWLAAAILIALSLLLSGSRAAILSGVVAAALTAFHATRNTAAPTRSPRRARSTATVAILLAGAAVLYVGTARNQTPLAGALWIRAEFAMTAMRMVASRPVFGVGIGQYQLRSGEFSSPKLRAIYPTENAHNNFLQILGELGIVGLALFLWLLWVAGQRVACLVRIRPQDTLGMGVAGGLLAFVGTWFAGHPLLIDEPGFSFWVLLGTATGWGTALAAGSHAAALDTGRAAQQPRAWMGYSIVLAIPLLLAASVPLRVRQELAVANLEHIGIGLSRWQQADDGALYRLAGPSSTVFLPAEARVVSLPLRSTPGHEQLDVDLYLEGRHADTVRVRSDQWRVFPIVIPERREGRRFRALELRPRGDGAGAPLLMVGKVQPR